MSILLLPKPITWIASNKWKVWRIINSATILFAFFMPWVMMDSANNASDNGFLLIQFLESITVAQLDLLRIDLPSRIKIVLFSIPLGLVMILIYCALNLFMAVFTIRLMDKAIWNIFISCLLALAGYSLSGILKITPLQDLPLLLWGYWIVCTGFVSSVFLEISYFISKRKSEALHQNIS